MRIKANVFSRGFRATADDPSKNYRKDLFKPFDPAIDKEFREKRSVIQNILADCAIAVPDNITDSKSPITILSTGSLTTPELALSALTELKSRGLLRDDRTIELNKWKKSAQYQAIMQEAKDAGCSHFREPCAVIKVTLYCRDEEEEFVFSSYPQEVLDDIDIYKEVPLEVAPIYEIAKHVRSYLNTLKSAVSEASSKRFKYWLKDAEESLNRTLSMLDGLELETNLANQFRANLKTAIGNAIPPMQMIATENFYFYARKMVGQLDPYIDVVANSGMDIFETRCTNGNDRFDVNQQRSKRELEKEINIGLGDL